MLLSHPCSLKVGIPPYRLWYYSTVSFWSSAGSLLHWALLWAVLNLSSFYRYCAGITLWRLVARLNFHLILRWHVLAGHQTTKRWIKVCYNNVQRFYWNTYYEFNFIRSDELVLWCDYQTHILASTIDKMDYGLEEFNPWASQDFFLLWFGARDYLQL